MRTTSLVRQIAAGAVPAALFAAFCGLTAVMDDLGVIPAALAIISISAGTPAVVLWAESMLTAAVAAGVAAALVVAAIVTDAWFVIPASALFMLPASAIACVARLRVRPEGETWADTGIEVLAGLAAFAVAVVVVFGLEGAERGLVLLATIGACLEARRRAPPLADRSA